MINNRKWLEYGIPNVHIEELNVFNLIMLKRFAKAIICFFLKKNNN